MYGGFVPSFSERGMTQSGPMRQRMARPCSDNVAHSRTSRPGRGRSGSGPTPSLCPEDPHIMDPPPLSPRCAPLKGRCPRRRPLFPRHRFFFAPTTPLSTPPPLPSISCRRMPPLRLPEIAGAAPLPKHRRPEPTPPPRRRTVVSVRPRRSRLARHLTLFLCEVSPSISPCLVTQLDAAGHASPPPRTWPPRGDH
jgi:hypothetical protein